MARFLHMLVKFALGASILAGQAQQVTSDVTDQVVFAAIPEETRTAFIERLYSVVRFQGTHDWVPLYYLLAEPDPKLKTDFLTARKKFDRHDAMYGIEFKPDHLTKLPEYSERKYEWIITGCAKYGTGKKAENHESSMYAVFRNGRWYFSELLINIRCWPNDPDPCQKPDSGTKQRTTDSSSR